MSICRTWSEDPEDKKPVILNHRAGSVGHPIPGVAVRITEPQSGEPLTLHQTGMILLRGANIFEGYLNEPRKTEAVLRDGWLKTGDIGGMDRDGFLYIEGRLSRFSKIGGEMVPHESVEAAINDALGIDSESERKVAIVGVPDESKGEALVLISAVRGLEVPPISGIGCWIAGIRRFGFPGRLSKCRKFPTWHPASWTSKPANG